MAVLTSETCWAVNSEIIKQVTSVGLSLYNYQDDARSNKHKIVTWALCVQDINLKYSDSCVRLFNARHATEYFRFNFLIAVTSKNVHCLYNGRKPDKFADFWRQVLPPSSRNTFEAIYSVEMSVNIHHSTGSPSKRKVVSVKKKCFVS